MAHCDLLWNIEFPIALLICSTFSTIGTRSMSFNVRLSDLSPTMRTESVINSSLALKGISLAIASIGMGIREGFDDRVIQTHWICRGANNTLHKVSAPSLIWSNSVDCSTASNSAIA